MNDMVVSIKVVNMVLVFISSWLLMWLMMLLVSVDISFEMSSVRE